MKRKTMLAIFTAAFTGLLLFTGCKQQEPDIYYTVTFNSDGGSYVSSQTVQSGSMATKPTDPTRDGYYFWCWYTEDGYWFDFNTSITRDITLTAQWDERRYTVTFDSDDGSSGGGYYYIQVTTYGNKIEKPDDPIKTGYTFAGWVDDNGYYFDFDTPITRDFALTATWQTAYKITFYNNGGSEIDPQYAGYGDKIEEPEPPINEGYTFEGWYTEDGNLFDFDTPITGDITLTARWKPISNVPTGGRPAGSKDLTTNESLNGTWKLTDGYGYADNLLNGRPTEYKTIKDLASKFTSEVYDLYHTSKSFFDENYCRTMTTVEAKELFSYLRNRIGSAGWIVINNDETRIDIYITRKTLFYNSDGTYIGEGKQEYNFTLEKQ